MENIFCLVTRDSIVLKAFREKASLIQFLKQEALDYPELSEEILKNLEDENIYEAAETLGYYCDDVELV